MPAASDGEGPAVVVTDAGENAVAAVGDNEPQQANGAGDASKKRGTHAQGGGGEQAAAKRPRREEGKIEGLQKCLLSGLRGIKQDALQGVVDRLGLPNSRLWKKREDPTAEVWLPEDPVFLKGAACVLNGTKVHGRIMQMAIAPEDSNGDGGSDGAPKAAGASPPQSERILADQVTPLHSLTYEEQVRFKEMCLLGSLKKLTVRMLTEVQRECKENPALGRLKWLKEAGRGPATPLDTFHPSPTQEGYRNKNEFTIGLDKAGKPCVGFRFGRFADGDVSIGCADGCKNIPEVALQAARALTVFLRDEQDLECWGPAKHTGVWRLLLVRHNSEGGAMIMVQYASRNCQAPQDAERLKGALEKLKTFLIAEAKRTGLNLVSLFVQEHNEVGNRAADSTPCELLCGAPVFHERLLGLSFRISPTAFFQVNTRAAEVLNKLIRDWAAADQDGIVLDVCCGTGTIGLCISQGALARHTAQPNPEI
jgi:tRNA/tmRNA/rRNA uracil-C5-methylase (TrmA/RlmC/RlmD family)